MFSAILLLIGASTVKEIENNCKNLMCSNIIDPVCGESVTSDGSRSIKMYQNICYLRKDSCKRGNEIYQVPDAECAIQRKLTLERNGRRVYDFGIIGARQTCNHSCPTYCVDTYDPACAQIYQPGGKSSSLRPMINHCHVDLFSCAVGVNVTIHPILKCYKNPSEFLFMSQIAALNSLKLLEVDEKSTIGKMKKNHNSLTSSIRRFNNEYLYNLIKEFQ